MSSLRSLISFIQCIPLERDEVCALRRVRSSECYWAYSGFLSTVLSGIMPFCTKWNFTMSSVAQWLLLNWLWFSLWREDLIKSPNTIPQRPVRAQLLISENNESCNKLVFIYLLEITLETIYY